MSSTTMAGVPFSWDPHAQKTDVFSRLYQNRIIFVNQELDDEYAYKNG